MLFMRVLVINADCLTRNSSANLCHLTYIKGLIENGHIVDVLSADGKDYQLDSAMSIPKEVTSYTIYGVSLYEKASISKSKRNKAIANNGTLNKDIASHTEHKSLGTFLKQMLLSFYGPHGIYRTFVRKAKKFSNADKYDLVLSISTPPASHLLAYKLIKKRNIQVRRWIQIWEDPWFSDAYGLNAKKSIFKAERKLLSVADKICFVSPLTLKNQQNYFPESSDKMFWEPLPSYYRYDTSKEVEDFCFGYFGDYVPEARDLKPFYEAAKKTNIKVEICGNPSNLFETTDRINIHPRLPLNELREIEDKTNVLIFLCNKKGGQIPGKIYQYAATTKTIIFILDGTMDEQKVLYNYFKKFNRFVFCKNNVESITNAIQEILCRKIEGVSNIPLDYFSPQNVIQRIIKRVEVKDV